MKQNIKPKINDNNFLIVGFGAEGRFVYDYLRKKYPSAEIAIADQNKIAAPDKKIKLYSGRNYLKQIKDYAVIIKSPGVPPHLKELTAAQKSGRVITSLTKIFFKECRGIILGITGTKGKSTVASLIYEILKQAGLKACLVGNIGHNPLSFLGDNQGKDKIFVYELSSHQLADLKQSPRLAIFLDIFPDHLPWHGSYKKYCLAKANLTKYQRASDHFIYNSRYRFIKNLAARSRAKKIDYQTLCRLKNGCIYYGRQKIMSLNKIKLLGRHNLENIFAVICLAKIFKIKNKTIAQTISNFSGLKHRLEFIKKINGVSFYDDAISTTPESTLAAINVFGDKLGTIFLGGLDRGYNFDRLARALLKIKIKNIIFFPDSGAKIWLSLKKIYRRQLAVLPKKLFTSKMGLAVKFAYNNTAPGQACLLSTASPSYSIFKNYIEKGNLFKKEVLKLKTKPLRLG